MAGFCQLVELARRGYVKIEFPYNVSINLHTTTTSANVNTTNPYCPSSKWLQMTPKASKMAPNGYQ